MKHLNEGLFEQNNWTYLIIEQKEHVNFFNNGYFSPNDYYKDNIDDNMFLLVNTNKNINSSSGQEFIKNQWKRKFGTFPQSVRCILSSNGSIEHAKYIKKIAKAIDLGKVTLKDVTIMCEECDEHWENKVPYVYGKIFYGNIKENKNIIKDMRRNNDRMLLESLVRKYGKNGVKNAIKNINESEISSKEAFKLLDELFDKYVPASGKADTYGGEILRAFAHLYYRCYNDGDVPFIGYGNETCNSSYRFLHEVSAPGFEKEYPMQSTYKEWFKYLDSIVVPFYQWISSEDAEYYFTIENTTDSRKALPEDFMYDEEDDYYDEYYDDED